MASRFSQLDLRFQPYADYLFRVAEMNGFKPYVTSTYRSPQKQAVLYERYQRGLSDLPAAPPGRSFHNYGLAFDMVVRQGYHSPEQYALGNLWRRMGGRWTERDPVHFQP